MQLSTTMDWDKAKFVQRGVRKKQDTYYWMTTSPVGVHVALQSSPRKSLIASCSTSGLARVAVPAIRSPPTGVITLLFAERRGRVDREMSAIALSLAVTDLPIGSMGDMPKHVAAVRPPRSRSVTTCRILCSFFPQEQISLIYSKQTKSVK